MIWYCSKRISVLQHVSLCFCLKSRTPITSCYFVNYRPLERCPSLGLKDAAFGLLPDYCLHNHISRSTSQMFGFMRWSSRPSATSFRLQWLRYAALFDTNDLCLTHAYVVQFSIRVNSCIDTMESENSKVECFSMHACICKDHTCSSSCSLESIYMFPTFEFSPQMFFSCLFFMLYASGSISL